MMSTHEDKIDEILDYFGIGPESDRHNEETTNENNNETTTNATKYPSHAYIGTPIKEAKQEGIFRLFAGNPNGLNLGVSGGDLSEYLEEMKRMQSDAVCLSEINLDTNKNSTKKKLHAACRSAYKNYKLQFSSSAIPSQEEYKPGGTLSLINGVHYGRVIADGADPMGRWTFQTLSCKDNRNMTIICAYQVCDQRIVENGRIKTMTATAQQTSMLRQQNRNETPRAAFITDLQSLLRIEQAKGHGILLLGDFNEPLDVTYDGMTKLCSDFEFTDLMFQLVGDDEFPTWFRGSDRRDDYALCDEWIADAIEGGCYETVYVTN
jgi:exonuclease III